MKTEDSYTFDTVVSLCSILRIGMFWMFVETCHIKIELTSRNAPRLVECGQIRSTMIKVSRNADIPTEKINFDHEVFEEISNI